MVFDESGYRFDFTSCLSVQKADITTYHDLANVDFIMETSDNIVLIEVKNPDHPNATTRSRKSFLEDLRSDVYPYLISDKFKNVLLCTWARGETLKKPIWCVLLIEFSMMTKTDIAMLQEKVFNRLPFSLNKAEFGSKQHFEKRFDLLAVNEFCSMFPMVSIVEVDECESF